jgi:hypothetical protein
LYTIKDLFQLYILDIDLIVKIIFGIVKDLSKLLMSPSPFTRSTKVCGPCHVQFQVGLLDSIITHHNQYLLNTLFHLFSTWYDSVCYNLQANTSNYWERISGLNCRLAWSKNKFFNVNPKISTNFQLQAAAFWHRQTALTWDLIFLFFSHPFPNLSFFPLHPKKRSISSHVTRLLY